MPPAADPSLYAPYTLVWTALLFAGFQTVVTTAILFKLAFRQSAAVPVAQPASASVAPAKVEHDIQQRCSKPQCGGKLGDIVGVFATDAGSFEERHCLTCKQVHLLKTS